MGLFGSLPGFGGPSIFDLIDFVDSVTSDPVTEGKKDGYDRAAREYEPIYQELKTEYDNAIAEIQRQKRLYDAESNAQIGYLAQLEKKRDDLQERVNYKAKQVASEYGVSVSTLMSSFAGTGVIRDTRWDMLGIITDSIMI